MTFYNLNWPCFVIEISRIFELKIIGLDKKKKKKKHITDPHCSLVFLVPPNTIPRRRTNVYMTCHKTFQMCP